MSPRARVCAALVCLFLAALAPTSATVLDPAWTESPWISTALTVTGMAWAPDGSGRLFLITKGGDVRIVLPGSPPTLQATPFATITPIYTASECGLIGIAFDPDFIQNNYVYFFVTVSSSEQQIIRYNAKNDTGSSKTVIVPGLPTVGANHDGGGLGFGRDGLLYWSIGNLGNGTGQNADLLTLAAKISRANPNGTVAPGNPFDDGAGPNNDYIFARGFRNPFALTFQPATGLPWVDVAGDTHEQIFAVAAGDHAGYNLYENTQPAGFLAPVIKYRTNGADSLSIFPGGAVRSSGVVTFTTSGLNYFRNGEKITIAGVTDPSFNGAFYIASTPSSTTFTVAQAGPDAASGGGTATTQNQGGAVTGGAFYDATAAPPAYRGNYFYGDYNSGRIMRAVVGPGTSVTSVDYFATGNTSSVDVSVGPDGALYYVGIPGTVYRAAYNAVAQGIVVSQAHLWMNEGRTAAFTVRLATAPVASTTVTVARTAGSGTLDVAAGAVLTFTPANYAVPQTVVLSSVEDADLLADVATFTVSSAGLTAEDIEVTANDTTGTTAGPSPGSVPDGAGVPGVPLTVAVNAGDPTRLDLAWGAGCGATGTDYSVHEGTIGLWYNHNTVACSTAGATSTTLLPAFGNRYFLVVPLDPQNEGSYGTDSTGAERPRSSLRCRAERLIGSCP